MQKIAKIKNGKKYSRLFDIEQERIDEELKQKINESANNINEEENLNGKIEFDDDLLKHLNIFKNYLEDLSESLYSKNIDKEILIFLLIILNKILKMM